MNRFTASLLLLIYLNASAQMLLPMLRDAVAHTFFRHEHLEHVHHGHHHSDHLQHEMATFASRHDQNDPQSHPAFSFSQEVLAAHLMPELPFLETSFSEVHSSLNGFWQFSFPFNFLPVFSPPPDRV